MEGVWRHGAIFFIVFLALVSAASKGQKSRVVYVVCAPNCWQVSGCSMPNVHYMGFACRPQQLLYPQIDAWCDASWWWCGGQQRSRHGYGTCSSRWVENTLGGACWFAIAIVVYFMVRRLIGCSSEDPVPPIADGIPVNQPYEYYQPSAPPWDEIGHETAEEAWPDLCTSWEWNPRGWQWKTRQRMVTEID